MLMNDAITVPVLKYLTGKLENICRLCFCVTENMVFLDQIKILECYYYSDSVTYQDMLDELRAPSELGLPQTLCEECADLTTRAFLFRKLCDHSYEKWYETMEILDKTLDYSKNLGSMVKTAYFLIQEEKNFMLTSRNTHKESTRKAVLEKVQVLLKQERNQKKKKPPNINKKHPCTLCHKVCKNQITLLMHNERVHKPKTLQCPKCAKMFSSEKLLKYHNSFHHKSSTCEQCFTEFPSKKELQQHAVKHNTLQCHLCSKQFKNKLVLKSHITTCGVDKKEKHFFCDICNKGYNRKNSLRSHLITEHGFGTIYQCNWCNKKYDAVSKLNIHIVKHTRERNFSCELCGSQFVSKAALTYHTRIHTGEKPFPCDICGERFLNTSRRMEHKRRKHFGPQYHCSICDGKFLSKFELNKHTARHKNPQSRLYVAENEGKTNNVRVKKVVYF